MSSDDKCLVSLRPSDLVGLTLMSEAGVLSMCADVLIGGMILRRVIKHWRSSPKVRAEWKLMKTPLDAYILSLIVSDFVQSLGSVLTIRWINQQQVFCGSYCTAQGFIQLLGETSSAMATVAIGVHTFLKIAFRLKLKNMWIARVVISLIWIYVILFAGIGAGVHHSRTVDSSGDPDLFDVPTPYWCWVGGRFSGERIGGEYLWLWLAALSSIVLYFPLYCIVGGQIHLDSSARLGVRLRARGESHQTGGVHFRILLYPIAYTIMVLPLSVSRWILFRTNKEPGSAVFATITLFELTGFVNVLLLFYTRGRINLLEDDPYDDDTSSDMMEGGNNTRHTRSGDPLESRDYVIEPTAMDGAGLPD